MGCSVQRPLRFQWILADNDPAWPDFTTQVELAAHRFVRLSWLGVLLLPDHPAFYRDYRRRFGLSMHTFRRDKRKLRRIGMYIVAILWLDLSTLRYLERTSLE
jgi:hypothetical protein